MEISKVMVHQFGKLKDFNIEFSKGMNVIYGHNEIGKSTILAFIKSMLYGIASKKKNIRHNYRKRYMPWDDDAAFGELHVKEGSVIYMIKRHFGEKKSQDKIEVLNGVSGEEITFDNMEKPGKSIFGIEENTYEKTSFIGQLASEVTKENSDEVLNYLNNLQGSGEASVSFNQTKKKLEDYRKYFANTKRKPGILDKAKEMYDMEFEKYNQLKHDKEKFDHKQSQKDYDLELEINQFASYKNIIGEANINSIRSRLIQAANYEDMLKQKKDEKVTLEKKLDQITSNSDILSMDRVKANEDLQSIIEENIRMEGYREKADRYNEIEKEVGVLKKEEKQKKENLAKMQYIIEEAEGLIQRIDDLKSQSEQIGNENKLERKMRNDRMALIASISVFFLMLVILLIQHKIPLPSALVFIIPIYYFFAKMIKTQKQRRHFLADKEEILKKMKSFDMKLSALYRSYSVENIKELREKYQLLHIEYGKIEMILKEKEKRLEEFNINQLLDTLNRGMGYIDLILKKYSCSNKEQLKEKIEDHSNLKLQFDQYNKSLKKVRLEEEQLFSQIQRLTGDIVEEIIIIYDNAITYLETKLNDIKKKILAYEREVSAIDEALAVMNEAFQKFHMAFGSRLNYEAVKVLKKITGEKYKELYISKDFDVKVKDQMEKEIHSIEYFSNGTWDQIYFSVRMGIANSIFEKINKHLPVLLDDAFVQYDDDRMTGALKYLYEYSKLNQVILFTCQRREVNYLKKYNDVNIILL